MHATQVTLIPFPQASLSASDLPCKLLPQGLSTCCAHFSYCIPSPFTPRVTALSAWLTTSVLVSGQHSASQSNLSHLFWPLRKVPCVP